MPYKLTYFNLHASAETTRMLFALADVEYEDVRVSQEEWQKLKPKSPFGQLPILEVDGHTLCQSHTMERFLCNRFGLNGKTEFEKAKSDMIVDCAEDFTIPLRKIFFEKDEAEKEKLKTKFAEDAETNFLPKFEALVTSEGGFLGSEVTWADVVFFNAMNFPFYLGIEMDFSKFPKLKGVRERTENNPKIAAWIKKRPESKF